MPAPPTTNSMHGGAPGKVSQAWIEQSKGAAGPGQKIEAAPTTTAPAGRDAMGASVLKLLNKTAEEKRNAIADVGEKSAATSTFERVASDPAAQAFTRAPSFGRVPSLRDAVKRAQEAEKLKAEQERVKNAVQKVGVSIKYLKHLPKMDKFGKTDAYCITVLDNKKFGGQKYKRKTKIVKKSLDPEFPRESYVFDVKNYPEQELVITVWDWDVGDDDDLVGEVKVPLAPLLEGKRHESSYDVLGSNGEPLTGHDGSTTIIRIALEKDPAAALGPDGVDVDTLVGDSEEIRTLVTPNWEHGVRGLMFDIENHSKFPVVITGFEGSAGRGKGEGSAAYTIYHAVGKWYVPRCPVCRITPFKFMKCCCGSCPSVGEDNDNVVTESSKKLILSLYWSARVYLDIVTA